MKPTICGADCARCPSRETCPGCAETNGCPHGVPCFIARCITDHGMDAYLALKQNLLAKLNALAIPGLPPVTELFALRGCFVNLEYPLPDGRRAKLLDDNAIYLGAQVAHPSAPGRYWGLVVSPELLLVSEYSADGTDARLILYDNGKEFSHE